MSIISAVDPKYDFWELYPELAYVEEFKLIKEKFKKQSSLVMWLIYFIYDLDSKFKNLDYIERAELLSKDIIGNLNFFKNNQQIVENAGVRWCSLNDTPAKRHLRQWLETLEKRTQFLKESDYTLDNYDKLDKMAVNTAALFKTFDEIQKQLSKEENGSITKGGFLPSLADDGEI